MSFITKVKKYVSYIQPLKKCLRVCFINIFYCNIKFRRGRCRAKKKHVVFFGDGDFNSSIKKHNSLPKKRLLKVMATKGLVFLLDEYRTSKMCPCGHDELITRDDTSSTRLRRHKTGDTACPLMHQIDDRDELACVNMLHCALKAIHGGQRPSFLCRPCDS